jgi:hypothetical protein
MVDGRRASGIRCFPSWAPMPQQGRVVRMRPAAVRRPCIHEFADSPRPSRKSAWSERDRVSGCGAIVDGFDGLMVRRGKSFAPAPPAIRQKLGTAPSPRQVSTNNVLKSLALPRGIRDFFRINNLGHKWDSRFPTQSLRFLFAVSH